MLSSVGQDDLEPYEYACEVPHKLFKFKSLSLAQNYLFLAMPDDRSLMFFPGFSLAGLNSVPWFSLARLGSPSRP